MIALGAKKLGQRPGPDAASAPAGAATAPVTQNRTRFDAATRAEAIHLDHIGAATDSEFQTLAASADSARDARRWADAEYHYWRALELYPFHSGYRIQYAHVIKEQGKLDWAEVHYRSAVAEGAQSSLVDEHLLFVAQRNGATFARDSKLDLEVAQFEAPPTFHDIQTLAWLFWHHSEINAHDALAVLRACASNRDVALAMIRHPRFVEHNRSFLEIMRG
ncbi:hypothetical protein [Polymorphobacter fuscus]|uniref:Tetratricopeptide repeat protein n=1 Tax=Sandarakinorhabdus fusca TaxID=1439888 RepID=A0A7C9KKV8_9SPHN|nr:hypothetical protein [Polymorphobacter fuscus]KAB7648370.1 hypothetical protein F9290_01215 [Polymorphobacter fuscus]MQT15884.1 hypothetical protein [Polymorphobacter fuscus]NJC07843.1 hypothetical protein [Polymorphobacter fuscus]